MEIQQTGRYITKEILSHLKEFKLLEVCGLDELTGPLESIVEISCLIHDIGNLPFGHFDETATDDWFRWRLYPEDAESQPLTNDRCSVAALYLWDREEPLNVLWRKVRRDLYHFEGNVQGIRLMYTLMWMNLTWAQVGGILGHTRPAWWRNEAPKIRRYLTKRPGYYLSEEAYIARLCKELNSASYSRFPLTWIMEAADDISYCVADLEGAVEKRIFTVEQLCHHLRGAWGQCEKDSPFSLVAENVWEKSRSNSLSHSTEDQFFMYLRVDTLNKLVPYATRRFIDNLPATSAGTFNHVLLENASECGDLLKLYKNIAVEHVSSHPDVGQFELQDYRVISGSLGVYRPLLNLPLSDSTELVEKERVKRFPTETRLSHELLTRHRLAYVEAVNKLPSDSPEFPLWEYCYRCRLPQDHINGMTGLYAWDECRRLMAVEQ